MCVQQQDLHTHSEISRKHAFWDPLFYSKLSQNISWFKFQGNSILKTLTDVLFLINQSKSDKKKMYSPHYISAGLWAFTLNHSQMLPEWKFSHNILNKPYIL